MSSTEDTVQGPLRQEQTADAGGINYIYVNRILLGIAVLIEVAVAVVTSVHAKTFGRRVGQAVGGSWLPGKVDIPMAACMTGKSEETMKSVFQGRSRYKVGGTAYFPVDEIAVLKTGKDDASNDET